MKKSATLVFDIGKTTKKALVFDHTFKVVDERTTTLPESQDDDGFPCEDLSLLTAWVAEMSRAFISDSSLSVTHVNVSGYGASLVCLDETGKPVLPFYNYLKPFPAELDAQFRLKYDEDGMLCTDTASPRLGMLNSGLQAYWLKHRKPDHFNSVKTLLHFPQFFPFLLSGKLMSEKTSIGCHTMLWDFKKMRYHSWAEREGIAALFPKAVSPEFKFPFRFGERIMTCGSGVHDSSAALMPYLVSMKEPFLLLSTGTWNICFNPFNADPLTQEELDKDCLCYLTYEGKPVKASRIFLGHEHEVQQRALSAHFQVAPDAHKEVVFDSVIYHSLVEHATAGKKFYPLEMEGTGPINEKPQQKTDFTAFTSFAEAQHQLIRSLVQWQKLSIDLVDSAGEIKNIIVVGGFTKSRLFLEILKREMRDRTILLSDHPRASALGAAWMVHDRAAYQQAADLLQLSKA